MNQNQDLMQVGEIIGVHGLDGEIKIRPYTEKPDNFFSFNKVIIKNKILAVKGCRVHSGKVYLFLDRVTKRTTAEKILKEKVFITRDQTDQPEDGEYFIIDLLGAQIKDRQTGELIGILKDIKQTGVVDNYEIEVDNKTILVPALKEYFEIIDCQTILADIPKEFFEL